MKERLTQVISNSNMKLNYYLVSSMVNIEDKYNLTYGIKIVKQQGFEKDESQVLDVSVSKERVEYMIGLLANNIVTPLTLKENIENLLY